MVTVSHPHLSVTEEETADACVIRDRLIHIPSMHSDPRRKVCLCVRVFLNGWVLGR